MDMSAYETCNFCPACGQRLKLIVTKVDTIKQCEEHPMMLHPSVNQYGQQVMIYDPHRTTVAYPDLTEYKQRTEDE